MNNSSRVDISKSSLVSLKAEILKKREELNTARFQNQNKILKPQKPLDIKNKGVEERQEKDTEDDVDVLQKSRDILEKKAKLYDKLSKGNNLNEVEIEYSKRMLVHFGKKKTKSRIPDLPNNMDDPDDTDKYPEKDEEETHYSDEYDDPGSPGEEWVEYTDCLGRTRKCLRKDLAAIKANDNDLSAKIDPERKKPPLETQTFVEQESKEDDIHNVEELNESTELLSSDMRREILRQQWEKEEEILRDKSDIHYQDILFNEARSHGVGYFAFSKDEEERAKQQQELNKLRKETENKQETTKVQKLQREKILAARMKAARNRKRARMGLPPEEEPEPVAEPAAPEIDPEEEKRKKEQEEKEKLLDMKRKQEVRPWDIGKEGLKQINKKHHEMSQGEWVDKKRKERPDEFAPPSVYTNARREFKSTARTDEAYEPEEKSLYFSSKKTATKTKTTTESYATPAEIQAEDFNPAVPPPNYSYPVIKTSVNPYKRKNYTPQTAVPIVDECVDFDDVQEEHFQAEEEESDKEKSDSEEEEEAAVKRKRAEIPPPPTFEHYGPSSSSKRTRASKVKPNFEDSIAAGLKFLRDQADKKHVANEKRVIYEH